ncbi:MAG: aspartyl protease family protein [Pyrinomonadaceae bacterium]
MKCKDLLTKIFQIPFRKKKFVYLVSIYLLTANFAAASGEIQQADATESRQLVKQAEKLTRRGEAQEAEKILRGIVERNPKDSAAKLALGYALLKQRRLNEAYTLSFEVAKSEPTNAHAFAVLGATLLSAGNFRDARISFINAVKLDNGEALAWSGYGMLDFYENRIFQGLDSLREAVYLNSREPDFLYSLAQVAARAERYKEAAAAYNKFLQISPQTDVERRDRIKGLISFLRFLGNRQSLYSLDGAEQTLVPFRLINDRPVIQVKLEKKGEPLNFILDTGSGVSVISEETAERLKIKPITRGGLARGIGGEGKFEIVYGFLPSVYVGDVKIKSVPVYIRKFQPTSERVDGYIGLSLISKFLTTIDYGNRTFALISKKAAQKQTVENGALSLPLRLTSSGFLSGEVNLEGVDAPLNFIVDTGASVSVISDALAGSKEISRFIRNEKMKVIGAAGITEDVPSFLLPRITFGTHSRQSVMAIALDLDLINETSGFEQAGILGGNFLKNYRLTFDFQNSKVIFEPLK